MSDTIHFDLEGLERIRLDISQDAQDIAFLSSSLALELENHLFKEFRNLKIPDFLNQLSSDMTGTALLIDQLSQQIQKLDKRSDVGKID